MPLHMSVPRSGASPSERRQHHATSSPPRLALLLALALALFTGFAASLRAQCLVDNPSFETVNLSVLPVPGWGPGPGPARVETILSTTPPTSGCPGWYTRLLSPDIFWGPKHVPSNYMTSTSSPLPAFDGSNYAGIATGRPTSTFRTEVLAGTLTSSPIPGQLYQIRARFAMGSLRSMPGKIRVSLDGGPTGPLVVGDMVVSSASWTLFSQFKTIPAGAAYNRIVFEGVDLSPQGDAYIFIDSVDVCPATNPCDFLKARLVKRPQSPQGQCCYDLYYDNLTPAGMNWPMAVRVNTTLPVQITGTAASSGWQMCCPLPSPTMATWGMILFGTPIPTGSGVNAGNYCVIPNGVTPQRHVIEFLDSAWGVLCRDTIYTDCEAQPLPCLDLYNAAITCLTPDASGNQRYNINFNARPIGTSTFPSGSSLRIRTTAGTLAPSTYSVGGLSVASLSTVFTDTPPKDSVICIIGDLHIMIGERDSIACSDTICITLPNCPRECCTNFTRIITGAKLTYVNGKVTLAGCALAGPNPIKRFSATIVGVLSSVTCPVTPRFSSTTWNRGFGDISAGSSISGMAGPVMVKAAFSREIVWGGTGNPTCVSFSPCKSFTINMDFPDPPAAPCTEVLTFMVRYSFTDCQCNTCDTVVTYVLPRKYTKVIWLPTDPLHNGTGDPPRPLGMANPGLLRIDMTSENQGTFSVTQPAGDPEAPVIRIIGMTLRPVGVALTEMRQQGSQTSSDITGNEAALDVTLDGGQSAVFDMTYANSESQSVIDNVVRYRYVIVGDEEQTEYESDDILVEAHIPAASGGDVVAEENNPQVPGVRTYVLHVDADNVAGEPVSALRVKVTGGSTRLIAVGPVGTGLEATLVPGTDGDGNTVVQLDPGQWQVLPLDAGASLTPVYLTFAGAASGATIDYETVNQHNSVLSSGSVSLGSPLRTAGTGSDVESRRESALWPIVPNPANASSTVGFSLHKPGTVVLSVRDLQGREVLRKVDHEQYGPGDHVMSLKTDTLAQGTYMVVLEVDGNVSTQTLKVLR